MYSNQHRGVEVRPIVIAAGETDSKPIDKSGFAFAGFQLPETMTATTIEILVSNDGINFVSTTDYESNETLGKKPAIAIGSREVFSLWTEAAGFAWFMLRCNAAEAQDRTILCSLNG